MKTSKNLKVYCLYEKSTAHSLCIEKKSFGFISVGWGTISRLRYESWSLTINSDFPNPTSYQKMNFEMDEIMTQVNKFTKEF